MKRWRRLGGSLVRASRSLVRRQLDAAAWQMAMLHRARLRDTTFIGITGSAGKTMTKFLIGRVLASQFPSSFTPGTRNNARSAARSVLRFARKGDAYHVIELSGHAPGALRPQLDLARPTIGIVTNIGTDHYAAFGSVDAIAAEKTALVRALPADGVAILNADDPRVLAMRSASAARVMTYGVSAEATFRASDVSSAWPSPLSFVVTHEDRVVRVQTQLFGTQWVGAVLATLAAAVAVGVPLDAAVREIEQVTPNAGRMSPLALPDGTTFIRDDWKASVHTIPPALDFLGAAQAKRKVAILGTISDTMGTPGRIYVNTARHALDVADVVCFVGPRASAALRAAPADRPERLRAFSTARAANQFLSEFLQPGDLVLLKGSNPSDHLIRLALSRTMNVACWQTDCGRRSSCERCDLVSVPSDAAPGPVAETPAEPDVADVPSTSEWAQRFQAEPGAQILVGLGNPGETRRGTPHNVGYELLDGLAETLNATWHNESDVTVAAAQWDGRAIWLVKPNAAMNLSGGALHRFSARAGFSPADCILVYDDHDLPLGTARTRLRGSDGGHRGVRSVLEAFQTDQFRRVKIGVKRASAAGTAARETVLTPFDVGERSQVESAFVLARQQLLALVQKPLPRAGEAAATPSTTQ